MHIRLSVSRTRAATSRASVALIKQATAVRSARTNTLTKQRVQQCTQMYSGQIADRLSTSRNQIIT